MVDPSQDRPGEDDPPDQQPGQGHRESIYEQFLEEAIETEMETGHEEETEEEARRHLLVRLARDVAGVVLVIVGIVLLVFPGPGWLTIAIGLTLLAPDVPFARRLLERVRSRLPEDDDGEVKTWVIVLSVAGTVLAMTISVIYVLMRH